MSQRARLVQLKDPALSLRRQCSLLQVNRNRFYYMPVPEKPENVKMMRIMDEHLLHHPTEGVWSMVHLLRDKGYPVGPKRIRRLFKLMGYRTLYRRKNLSKMGSREYIRPYLLRDMEITRSNQVWSTDITYIPMAKGFMYMTAIIDVYSRKILSWGISNSMDVQWCKKVLDEALELHGKPEIINSDQGSQYTSAIWTQYLESLDIKISMDGKGRATDNRWIERFWKTIKYNWIYLNPPENGMDLYQGVDYYVNYYNRKVHHTTRRKPNDLYKESVLNIAA